MCAPFARLSTGTGPLLGRGKLVAHCMLIETDKHGLVLVDTGFGLDDARQSAARLGRAFMWSVGGLQEHECAVRQVERLGFAAGDVRHIVLSHMDLDHAGGLADFPGARVHVMRNEHLAANQRAGLHGTVRYKPCQWAHGPNFAFYDVAAGEQYRGFSRVQELGELPPEILMIPLDGHTAGHACVAVELTSDQGTNQTLFYAGDAYFHRSTVRPGSAPLPHGLLGYERMLAQSQAKLRKNHQQLKALAKEPGVALFCAHDPEEYRSLQEPALQQNE
jgi:glyoxylase-like metal-dependent hydrolase (beta-lactamase superfamily II)